MSRDNTAAIVMGGVLGLTGVGVLLYAMSQQGRSNIPIGSLLPGEAASDPYCQSIDLLPGQVEIPLQSAGPGQIIFAGTDPRINYSGPGRDTFTNLSFFQKQAGRWVCVAASGLAAVHVGPADSLTAFPLVSPQQPQPSGCPSQSLCVYAWPGTAPAPICGAHPLPGPANVVLQVYEKRTAADGDGFTSPTCNPMRVAIKVREWQSKVIFV